MAAPAHQCLLSDIFSCGRHELADGFELGLLGWLTGLGWKTGKENAGAHVFNNTAITMREGTTTHVLKRYAAFEEHTSRIRDGLPVCCFSRVFIIFLPSKEFNHLNHRSVFAFYSAFWPYILIYALLCMYSTTSRLPSIRCRQRRPSSRVARLLINLRRLP